MSEPYFWWNDAQKELGEQLHIRHRRLDPAPARLDAEHIHHCGNVQPLRAVRGTSLTGGAYPGGIRLQDLLVVELNGPHDLVGHEVHMLRHRAPARAPHALVAKVRIRAGFLLDDFS